MATKLQSINVNELWGDLATETTSVVMPAVVPEQAAEDTEKMVPQVEILFVFQAIWHKLGELQQINERLAVLYQNQSFPLLGYDVEGESDYAQAIDELELDKDQIGVMIEDYIKDYTRLYKEIHARELQELTERREALYELFWSLNKKQEAHYKLQKELYERKENRKAISAERALMEAAQHEAVQVADELELLEAKISKFDYAEQPY